MSRNRRTALTVALLTTTTLSLAWAMQPTPEASRPAQPAAKGQPVMPADCASMGRMCEEMMAQQKDADAKLDRLVSNMNIAAGPLKPEAMAAVINELVVQRTEAHTRMAEMQPMMMMHMMQHIQDAAPTEMQDKMQAQMDECPMMQSGGSPDHKRPGMTPRQR